MSVTQHFTVGIAGLHPDGEAVAPVVMTREQVEELHADLSEALGLSSGGTLPEGMADDLGYLRGMIDQVAETLAQFVSAITGEVPTHTESVADIERRLAAEQATAQPAARRSSGSGIGNAHV